MESLRPWCDRCNWNAATPRTIDDQGFFGRKYIEIGERRGLRTLAALIAAPVEALRPRLTPAKAAAFAIAAAVHLVTLSAFLAGAALLITGFPDMLLLLAGAACCGFGWLLFPRVPARPKRTLAEADYPAFFALIREITEKLGGRPIRYVVVDDDFNASYSLAGRGREPVLHFGLPLWIALQPQQRVAIIAHEIAHGVNGDSTRGFMIGTALNALCEWIGLFRPAHCAVDSTEWLARHVTWVMAVPLVALNDLLVHLLWQEKQRAEYFADYLATTVGGTPATLDALTRTGLHEHLDAVLLRHAVSTSQSGAYILGLFRKRIETLPAREWERFRRASEAEGARLDASHPPTAFRKAFLRAHPAEPSLVVGAERMAAIDAELSRLEERIGAKLIARFARD